MINFVYKGKLEELKKIMYPFEYITKGLEGYIFKYQNICRKVYFNPKNIFGIIRIIRIHNKFWDNKIKIKKDKIYFLEQDFLLGEHPSLEEIKFFLKSKGFNFNFKIIPYFKKNNIIMTEILPQNWIKTDSGIFPIDEIYYYNFEFFLINLFLRIKRLIKKKLIYT